MQVNNLGINLLIFFIFIHFAKIYEKFPFFLLKSYQEIIKLLITFKQDLLFILCLLNNENSIKLLSENISFSDIRLRNHIGMYFKDGLL